MRNNWITVVNQQFLLKKIAFHMWPNIHALYEKDWKLTIRMTKITHSAAYLKPFQRCHLRSHCVCTNDN